MSASPKMEVANTTAITQLKVTHVSARIATNLKADAHLKVALSQ